MHLYLTLMLLLRLMLVVAGICLFLLTPMFAQASDGSAPSGGLLDSLRPVLSIIADILIGAVIAWAAARYRAATGRDIEARHREALHSALSTGVGIAIKRLGADPSALHHSRAVDIVIDWTRQGAGDAVRYFDLDSGALRNLAAGKLGQALPVTPAGRDAAS